VGWLVERQAEDGSWAASARMLAPRPDVTDVSSKPVEAAASLDDNRVFTTGAVLWALAEAAA
jgi:hypothetical protein